MGSDYLPTVEVADLPVGAMKKVTLNGKEILLTNIEGDIYAVDSVCTHFGGDLSLGTLEGNVITCPRHQAKFDVTTGRVCIASKS